MTTIAQARTLVRDRLLKGTNRSIDILNGAINDTVATVTTTLNTTGIGVGYVIEIDDEQMFITVKATNTLTVIRGWNSTTAASHSDNAIIEVNPRFTSKSLSDTISEELQSWPLRFGRIDTVEVTIPAGDWKAMLSPTTVGATINRLLTANVLDRTGDNSGQRSRIDCRLLRDRDLDEFTTGYAIQLPHTFYESVVVQVDILTGYDFSAIDTGTTILESDVGLRAEMLDVLYYGMMWREMATLEIGRTDVGARPAQDNEQSPPTHLLQTSQAIKALRDQRMQDETRRLYDMYPVMMSTEG